MPGAVRQAFSAHHGSDAVGRSGVVLFRPESSLTWPGAPASCRASVISSLWWCVDKSPSGGPSKASADGEVPGKKRGMRWRETGETPRPRLAVRRPMHGSMACFADAKRMFLVPEYRDTSLFGVIHNAGATASHHAQRGRAGVPLISYHRRRRAEL